MSLTILGTGSRLGKRVVSNDDLAAFLDTSDDWIRPRTGVCERHIMEGENVTALAIAAAKAALANAGTDVAEIDYILCPTLGGDYITPSLACMVQAGLGANCPALDLNGACSGFLYGLDIAAALLCAGRAKRILMVAGEGLSRVTDWTDRSTCILFGDGAGAVVLAPGEDLLYLEVTADGLPGPLHIPFPKGNGPWAQPGPAAASFIHMDGQEVYKFAVSAINTGVDKALAATGLTAKKVDHLVLHQANLRIVEAARRRLGIPEERCPTNIAGVGNMSAASIPVLLDECNRAGRLHPGDILVMAGFGGGLTTGTAVLRWKQGQ